MRVAVLGLELDLRRDNIEPFFVNGYFGIACFSLLSGDLVLKLDSLWLCRLQGLSLAWLNANNFTLRGEWRKHNLPGDLRFQVLGLGRVDMLAGDS